eukprot:scaffold423_cov61-Cylindrotheca_fusiformis.AAC.1
MGPPCVRRSRGSRLPIILRAPAGSLTKSNLWPRNWLTLYGGTQFIGSKRHIEPYSPKQDSLVHDY